MTDKREPTKSSKELPATNETTVSSGTPSVASSLAGMFLEENYNKGRQIEIPSLHITKQKGQQRDNSNGNHKQ